MPEGNVTCNGLLRSLSLLKDQFSASSVKSSQLCEICIAVCTSLSWFTSRVLMSAHSSWRNWDTRGVRRGPGLTANGLKLVEYRRARGVNMFIFGVGDASLENKTNIFNQLCWSWKKCQFYWNQYRSTYKKKRLWYQNDIIILPNICLKWWIDPFRKQIKYLLFLIKLLFFKECIQWIEQKPTAFI